jgi:hypothetical protein
MVSIFIQIFHQIEISYNSTKLFISFMALTYYNFGLHDYTHVILHIWTPYCEILYHKALNIKLYFLDKTYM